MIMVGIITGEKILLEVIVMDEIINSLTLEERLYLCSYLNIFYDDNIVDKLRTRCELDESSLSNIVERSVKCVFK